MTFEQDNLYGGHGVADVWSNGEIVRAVIELTAAVKDLGRVIAELDNKYVRKDVAEVRYKSVLDRMEEHGEELANLGADLTRFRREATDATSANWSKWVIPIVTGISIAVITVLITLLTSPH